MPIDMYMIEFLSYPFMQRALIAGLLLGILLASLGVIVTLRRMAFFGEGIAHASLAGIAIALLSGMNSLPVAILWSVILALLIFVLEKRTQLSTDAVIGIFFTFSMAIGVVIIHLIPGYQPELISFLFGSILSISVTDVFVITGCTFLILSWYYVSRQQLLFLSLSEEQAIVSGVPVQVQTALLYVALAIATVLGVKMLGIILISALLILPASTSQLFSASLRHHVILSILIAECTIFFGLALSFYLDLPSGATIVLLGSILFFVVSLKRLFRWS